MISNCIHYLRQRRRNMFSPASPRSFVCLSVCKITHKGVHGFGWNVACRQMSGHRRTDLLLSPIRVIVRMPEPDFFVWYRIGYGTLQPCLVWWSEVPQPFSYVTVQDVDDDTIDCHLYLRRAVDHSFRVYTLIAENRIAVTSVRVPLFRSEFAAY